MMPTTFLACLSVLLLLPPPAKACSAMQCPDLSHLSNNPSLCGLNTYESERPDSALHVRVVNNTRSGPAFSCVVEQTEDFKTTQELLAVQIIDVLYSDIGHQLNVSGDTVWLDFGSWTVHNCTGNWETDPRICWNSCGPVSSDIFEAAFFEAGKEYVLYVNRLPWPHRFMFADEEEAMGANTSSARNSTKFVCGVETQFFVASGSACDNNMVEPSASEVQQLKTTCGTGVAVGPVGSNEDFAPVSEVGRNAMLWMECLVLAHAAMALLLH